MPDPINLRELDITMITDIDPNLDCFDEGRTEAAIAQADQLVLRRWKANARERQRVKKLCIAFGKLRDVTPVQPDECHLTRMDVLCRAMEYIRCLERELHGEGQGIPPLLQIMRTSNTRRTKLERSSSGEDEYFRAVIGNLTRIASSPLLVQTSIPNGQCGRGPRRLNSESACSEISFVSDESGQTAFSNSTCSTVFCDKLTPDSLNNVSDVESCNNCKTNSHQSGDANLSSEEDDASNPEHNISLHVLRRIPACRVAVNQQLRSRSKTMQEAFADLRRIVPIDALSPHLSKAKFLRHTSRYIANLRAMVESDA